MNNIRQHLRAVGEKQLPQRTRHPRHWDQVSPEDQALMKLFAETKSSGSKSTFRRYVRVISQLMMWLDKPLHLINSGDLRQYQRFLADPAPAFMMLDDNRFKPAEDKTIDDMFVVIRLFCTFLLNEGVITNNPAKNIMNLKRGERTETNNYFTPYKWELLHETLIDLPYRTKGERNYAERMRFCIAVEYGLALRPDEMCRHTLHDLYRGDYNQYKIDIHGKGNKTRTLVIDESTQESMHRFHHYVGYF